MRNVGRLVKNSFLYTFSSLLIKAIGFLMLPVYTYFLSPQDYGITNLATSFIGVGTFIVSFSLYSAIIRFYTDYKDDKEILKRFFGTIVIFVFCSGVLFVGLAFLLQKWIVAWFFSGIAFYPVVVIALLTLIFVCEYSVHQSIMQGMQTGKKLTIRNLVVFGLQVGFNLLFIAVYKLGAVGVLLASLTINSLYIIYMLIDLIHNDLITFCIDKTLLREALKYSIPIMPHNLSTSIAQFAERIFINSTSSLASVGLYSIAWQFGLIIDIIQTSVNQAFAPWFYDVMKWEDEEGKRGIIVLSKFLLIIYSLTYMAIGLFSQDVLMFMTNKRYHMAWTVIPILVVAFSVKSMYYFYVNILFYYKQAANKIFISTMIGSLADIILASILTTWYGMYGAAISFLVAKIIVITIVVVISKMYDDIGYRVLDMLKTIIPSLLFMWGGLYFSYTKYLTTFNWMNFFYKLSVLFAYLMFIYLTNKLTINNIIRSGKIQELLRNR